MFTLRFDMRARDGVETAPDLYAAALDMAEWGERNGCLSVQVCEHHASEDGYLPTPLLLASAIAARTKNLPIQVTALIVPLHDPIELAEQMAVLDLLSRGRVSYVCGVGYREEEYAMFGRAKRGRGRRMEEAITAMRQAWSGEPFEFEGRPVRVTPRPNTPGGPTLLMGGGSEIAVRRAARLGMGMLTQGGDPTLDRTYREACAEYGTTPALFINPPAGLPTQAFVAEDPDAAWRALGPYLLHDAQAYARWMGDARSVTKSEASTVEELRAARGAYRIFTPDEAIESARRNGVLMTHPLCGGIPPDLAWPSLELIEKRVLPALRAG